MFVEITENISIIPYSSDKQDKLYTSWIVSYIVIKFMWSFYQSHGKQRQINSLQNRIKSLLLIIYFQKLYFKQYNITIRKIK